MEQNKLMRAFADKNLINIDRKAGRAINDDLPHTLVEYEFLIKNGCHLRSIRGLTSKWLMVNLKTQD